MFLLIIGVVLAGLGLVATAMTSRGRSSRIAAASVGALGILLLIVSWSGRNLPTNRAKWIRSKCANATMKLESFEILRTADPPLWTSKEAQAQWEIMNVLLGPIAEICIKKPASCDRPLATNPSIPTFSMDVHDLSHAIFTGEPCQP